MISEELQDQAMTYVLGGLEPNEAAAFEAMIQRDADLRALVKDLRDTAAAIALTAPAREPPAELKSRIMRETAVELSHGGARRGASPVLWLPWSIAALFMICCGVLLYDRAHLRRELLEQRGRDPLADVAFVTLAPQKDAPPQAKAAVAWATAKQTGVIRVSGLQPIPGKDYQLWAVDAAYKDPVSAGIVHVGADGTAQARFTPVAVVHQIKAFAISLEHEGGVAKVQGPILLVGSTT